MSIRPEIFEEIDKLLANNSLDFLSKIKLQYKLFSVILSDEGWYLDYELAVNDLAHMCSHQIHTNSEKLDEYMIRFYKKKLKDIILLFKKRLPERYTILKKAFSAHKKRNYELSIPVFF
ncbi:MAG: hypothetical protein JXL97_06560 [Bacteroidales bacterium]|nr:hypothetical protein [Bacteroidales bacterium]